MSDVVPRRPALRSRRLALATASTVAALALALGALELVLRLAPTGPAPREWYLGGNHPRGLVRADPALGYTLAPGFSGRDVNAAGDFDVPVAVSSLGLRDVERDLAGCSEILIALGDSFAYGEGVPLERTFLSILEARLGERTGGRTCILKAGVPGYGLHQMAGLYRRLGAIRRHRLVLVGIMHDDLMRVGQGFTERAGWLVHEAWAPVLESCPDGAIHVRKARLAAAEHALYCASRAYRWLSGRRLPGDDGRALGTLLVPDLQPAARTDGVDDAALAKLFLEMKDFAASQGAGLIVAGICFDDPRLASFLRANDIGFVPLLCERSWLFPHDLHFNEAGHEAVAQELLGPVSAALGR